MESTQNAQVNYPTSEQIDPEQAKFLYEHHCAILIVEGLPIGSEFGIDLVAYRVGEKFKGVKLIPPGLHFIYASATDKEKRQCGPRCGFFYNFRQREILIKKWSSQDEDFDDTFHPSEEHLDSYRKNVRELDRYLGAYNFSNYKSYLNLTSKLTSSLVESLMPDCNRIRSVPYLTRDSSLQATSSSGPKRVARAKLDNDASSTPGVATEETLLPDLKPEKSTVIHFTRIPDNHIESGQLISHEKVTEYNLDSTMKLDSSFTGKDGRERFLAEFQFAFIVFLFCHVYECFEQWKKLLILVCSADAGLSDYPSFYGEFVAILRDQFHHVPEDLFDDIVDSNNVIRFMLDTFFQNLENNLGEIEDLRRSAAALRRHLEDRFKWQFDLEAIDEQPVVVEL